MNPRVAAVLWVLFLILGIFSITVYAHNHPNLVLDAQAELQKLPFIQACAKPLPYTVGTIDPRFNLSKDQIVTKLQEAATIWNVEQGILNSAATSPLLKYDPTNPNAVPVNFVYDTRQEAVVVGQKIDSTEASQDSQRASLEVTQQAFIAKQQSYANEVAAFNSDSQAYAAEVARVNASGGADQATYARLNSEKSALKTRQQQLNAEADELNQEAAALKARVASFNAGVKDINQAVQDFNATVGGNFEEGQYVQSGTSKHIDIYAYKSQSELLHTLAHEFGHSLGLPHNSNPASIMYPLNKDGTTLSSDDIAALKLACKL